MKIMINIAIVMLSISFIFTGCSKKVEEYNKPAMYWYTKMIKAVSNGDLEKADSFYSSLQGEHISSPLLPEATMILAIAHMHYEEYILSEHFLDEYTKRYATENEKEFADFLKIKAMYKALPNPRRDQVLIIDAIKKAKKFKQTYPNSMYMGIVDTMITRLELAEAVLNETIARLYERLDKPLSAKYYRELTPQSWIDFKNLKRANSPWYREWFEGDGTDSWYAFMIPDTQSVVSRNINSENKSENKEAKSHWYSDWYKGFISEDSDKDKNETTEEQEPIDEHSSEQLPLD
ncbi:MAG: outer membrane protein assembly factor BamD [Campylobacterales bacterium]